MQSQQHDAHRLAGKAAGKAIAALQEAQVQLADAQRKALELNECYDAIVLREHIERANITVAYAITMTTLAVDHAQQVVKNSDLDVRRTCDASEAKVISLSKARIERDVDK